ncbi:MAG: DMT family transporter [Candidatus Thorarchaeota archaeon]|jgi:drug/metabolite transporter (DMT)-like permease
MNSRSESFAVQNVIIKWIGEDVRPVAANSIRVWISLPIVLFIAVNPFRQANLALPIETYVVLALSVFFAAGFGDVVFFQGQDRIGVSAAFAIANTYPIVTYLLAILFLGDLFIPVRFIGVVLAITGIILISREQDVQYPDEPEVETKGIDKLGYLMAASTAVMFALATIMVDIGTVSVDPLDANLIRLAFGSVMLMPTFYFSRRMGMRMPSRRGIKIVGGAAILGMALASTFWVASVKYIGATISAVIGSTSPLFALPFSMRYLDETVNWKVGIGTAATIIGIWITLIAG